MNELNKELIIKEVRRAKKALKAAQNLLRDSLYEDAVSRAYYAILHSAKAALLTKNITVSTHKAVLSMFSQHLVKTNLIEKEYGVILREEKEDREISDYDVLKEFNRKRVQKRVKDAEKFIDRIDSFLQLKLGNAIL